MKSFRYLKVTQPIGVFYLVSMPASYLLRVVRSVSRFDSEEGIQRQLSRERLKSIADYCSDPDAVFPTPIVVSINAGAPVDLHEENETMDFPDENELESGEFIGEVIDGQHRLWGIEQSNHVNEFYLPVVLMFDLTLEEKAYVFSTINSNQTKVPTSLIYELFSVSILRSPQKTSHQIARSLNSDPNSPFFNRLKMLGVKEDGQDKATLSQGIFVKELLKLISRNPDFDARCIKKNILLKNDENLVFRQFFVADKDAIILKIMLNCFNALKEVFPKEWNDPSTNILWKSTGFAGVMAALPFLIKEGIKQKVLNFDYFERCFCNFHRCLQSQNKQLTSSDFPGGGQQVQSRIRDMIKESQSLNSDTCN